VSPLSSPKPQWRLDAESDAETLAIFAAERGWLPYVPELNLRTDLHLASLYGPRIDIEGAAHLSAHAAFRAAPGLRGPE